MIRFVGAFLCKEPGLSGLFGSYSFDCPGCPVLWFEQTVVVQRVGLILGRADQLGAQKLHAPAQAHMLLRDECLCTLVYRSGSPSEV